MWRGDTLLPPDALVRRPSYRKVFCIMCSCVQIDFNRGDQFIQAARDRLVGLRRG
jgi:hypothetical protein